MSTETLLVELGTEELPPKALKTLALAFRDAIVAGLAERELDHGEVEWFATPRRLAVQIASLQLQAPERTTQALGPPVDRAKDDSGNWTPAAAGFAKKQGVKPDALEIIDTAKGARLGLQQVVAGASAAQELAPILNAAVQALPIPKRMRWGASREEFVRPVHWLVAMLGADVTPGAVLGITAGNTTYGHRFHHPEPIALTHAKDYRQALADAKVVASYEERKVMVAEQVATEASALLATAVIDDDLLEEVTALVEWPIALTGSFEGRFLEVPAEALISSMKAHQKYFHVVDNDGKLVPHFITVANIDSKDPVQVIAGNERVIRPRLADAAFFYETDKKKPLAERLPALDAIVFQQKLGTLREKTERVAQLAKALAPKLGCDPALAQRAALLSKADLVTDMVQEFSDMQGIAGAYYARHDGEDPAVVDAIKQQYWPKFAGDKLPESATACAVGLADRLDTLVGIFGIGQAPTGSKDPFALRRASLAVLRIIVEKELDLDLRECLALAANGFPSGVIAADTTDQVLQYMLERFRAWYEEESIAAEVFQAVSAKNLSDPLDIHRRVQAVHSFAQLPEAQALAAANKRVSNILGKLDADHSFGDVSANLLVEAQEKTLSAQVEALSAECEALLQHGAYTDALASLAGLREPVDAFFDDVMVNVEEEDIRRNRLNLLKHLRDLFLEVADISLLAVGK